MADNLKTALTDAEIKKALECCLTAKGCDDCPYQKREMSCYWEQSLTRDALDLINRQQAEIERVKKLLADEEAKYNKCAKHFYIAGVKEFAERLKNEIISDTAYGCDTNQHTGYYDYTIKIGDIPEYIDNLVKEMAGE